MSIANDTSRLANIDLNYWFYGRSAFASISDMANLRGVVRADNDASSMPCTLDARTGSTESW